METIPVFNTNTSSGSFIFIADGMISADAESANFNKPSRWFGLARLLARISQLGSSECITLRFFVGHFSSIMVQGRGQEISSLV